MGKAPFDRRTQHSRGARGAHSRAVHHVNENAEVMCRKKGGKVGKGMRLPIDATRRVQDTLGRRTRAR